MLRVRIKASFQGPSSSAKDLTKNGLEPAGYWKAFIRQRCNITEMFGSFMAMFAFWNRNVWLLYDGIIALHAVQLGQHFFAFPAAWPFHVDLKISNISGQNDEKCPIRDGRGLLEGILWCTSGFKANRIHQSLFSGGAWILSAIQGLQVLHYRPQSVGLKSKTLMEFWKPFLTMLDPPSGSRRSV